MHSRGTQSTTGIETHPVVEVDAESDQEIIQALELHSQHLRLTQVILADGSDQNNELVLERQWLLHPSNGTLSLSGNLFLLEDLAQESGRLFIKRAPLPGARPIPSACDLQVVPDKGCGFKLSLMQAKGCTAETWTALDYRGDCVERMRVMQDWQRNQRPKTAGHALPRFLSNTWGDRSRDSRIQENFIKAEIAAAHRLGVEVVQLDDGWQKGTSSNSAKAAQLGGVWEGFWKTDPNFWDPHPERFPHGLKPVLDEASSWGIKIGLWFVPDSWNDFSNWRRDADRVLELFHSLGVEHFKIDGINAKTELALRNLHSFFGAVLEGSQGAIILDIDITAGTRPGYFGAMEGGLLYVENRYTDWHNYWPHHTLRNLWKLSRWIDPRRLRMEFLNNARNAERYNDDPLSPAQYAPDTLFATVMFSNPLGWFEVSNLPGPYIESASRLIRTWKEHREALFSGTILPIGNEPDGFAYTGFMSVSEACDYGYVLLFRELHPENCTTISIPAIGPGDYTFEILASEGSIEVHDKTLTASIPKPLGFLFARFTRK